MLQINTWGRYFTGINVGFLKKWRVAQLELLNWTIYTVQLRNTKRYSMKAILNMHNMSHFIQQIKHLVE